MILAYTMFMVIAIGALRALVFQFLWNWLAVDLFGCPISLTFWTAWAMLIMANMLTAQPLTLTTKGSK